MAASLTVAVRVPLIAALLMILSVRPGSAQTTVESFDQLSQVLKSGTRVFVTDEKGQRIKGRITELSGSALEVRESGGSGRTLSFAADRVTRVARVDSRLSGFLIGFAAGAAPGAALGWGYNQYCGNESSHDCPAAIPIIGGLFGLIGGGIGFAIDNAINGQTLVFARRRTTQVRLTPMFGDHASGVRVSLKF